jgi:amino-acid N-acetyltransferase
MADVPHLLRLINGYAARGIMLPRTEFEISENLRDFSVIHSGDRVAGCAALHFYTPTMGEIRSLAVDAAFQGSGAGRKLMEALEDEAQTFGLEAVFAFTYIPEFFAKLGFVEIERGELPLKAWKDCLRCPKFQCCDEIAVIKQLETEHPRVDHTLLRGSPNLPDVMPGGTVLLPSLRKSH